ncbi:hypothetical protein K1719_000380 [Acacia pycnantha]|nr:hypothetical protein K1719_000380 [Acacia pycnantha]
MEGPSYAGGCIPISEHRRKIVESGEVPEGSIEWATFERTHSRQSEGSERQWINQKALQVAETFQKLSQERGSQLGVAVGQQGERGVELMVKLGLWAEEKYQLRGVYTASIIAIRIE